MPHEYRQIFRRKQIAFRSLHFLQVVQAPGDGFRQRHAAGFIRNKGVDLLLGGVIHGLGNVLARRVFELEGSAGKHDGPPCFRVRLEQAQTVADGLVGERQGRRIVQIFGTVNLKGNGAFDFISRRALGLLQHIHAIGQGLGFRIPVFIRHQMVALHLPGVLVGTGALQVDVELRARFRCFHAAGIGSGVHAAQDFDHSLRAVADFVGFQTFIGYDRRLGLLRGAAGVHQEGFAAGLISFRRGQLDNFIHSGPEQLRGYGGICSCRGQPVRHHLAFGEYYMALPVGNILGGQHLKNRARQLAVTADGGGADVAGFRQQGLGTGGTVGIVPGIFLRVALVQFEPHLYRLIGCRQLGGHVGLYRSLQGDFFKHIPRRFPMLPDDVPPLA